jgi:hypothetical protein
MYSPFKNTFKNIQNIFKPYSKFKTYPNTDSKHSNQKMPASPLYNPFLWGRVRGEGLGFMIKPHKAYIILISQDSFAFRAQKVVTLPCNVPPCGRV